VEPDLLVERAEHLLGFLARLADDDPLPVRASAMA
jgi:hypothetical protein